MTSAEGPVVRFAPSPTGRLHVGNTRVALVNWLFARAHGGRFVLRHDDTDAARSGTAHIEGIEDDLRWLRCDWTARIRQSERRGVYAQAADRLRAAGRLYPCYETAEELAAKRRALAAARRPPVYDRAALSLSAADRAGLEAQGRRPHWRFQLEPGRVRWRDAVHGAMDLDPSAASDPVLVREDGAPLYALSSVVDDAELGVTHVIRGDDHLSNTPAQLRIFAALGAPAPVFAHLGLLVGADGGSLSKRLGSLAVAALRDDGVEPAALAATLARLGTRNPAVPISRLDDLVPGFDLAQFGSAPAQFDVRELWSVNAGSVRAMSLDVVRERLPRAVPEAEAEAFWEAVRPNLDRVAGVDAWAEIVYGAVRPEVEDPTFLGRAADLLPPAPWDGETWVGWTTAVASATGATGRRLLRPLRLALTGRGHGPEMKKLLPLIGRARAAARLRGQEV